MRCTSPAAAVQCACAAAGEGINAVRRRRRQRRPAISVGNRSSSRSHVSARTSHPVFTSFFSEIFCTRDRPSSFGVIFFFSKFSRAFPPSVLFFVRTRAVPLVVYSPPSTSENHHVQPSDNVVVVVVEDQCDADAGIVGSRSDTHGMGTNLSKGRHVSAAARSRLPTPPTSTYPSTYPSTERTADVLYKFFLGTVKKKK